MDNLNSEGFLSHHFIDINCTGNESKLTDCPHNRLTHYLCYSWHDAAIFCVNGKTNVSSVSIYALHYRWSS